MKLWICIVLTACLLAGCAGAQSTQWSLPESPYAPEDFLRTGAFLSCQSGGVQVGVDVSSHQGKIDWTQVADAGVTFAFIRLGYRGYSNGVTALDTLALENLQGAKAAGLQVGGYWFSQAVTEAEAREEARLALELLDGMALELPVVYDWEYVSQDARTAQVDRQTLTACTLAFCREVESVGYEAMIYFNTSQGQDMLELEKLEDYAWWLAKYDLKADFLCRADMWQYTNTGSVPGIQGKVDINLLFTDFGLGQAVFGQVS